VGWRAASFLTLALWGSYGIFASRANVIHGEKVTMAFEAAAMVLIAIASLAVYGASDISKITSASAMHASIMALMSAGGLYIQFYAFRHGGASNMSLIIVITGSFPVITVVLGQLMGIYLTTHQWIGVAMVSIGLVLVNWTK
jgi:uncharacterized membrane protein